MRLLEVKNVYVVRDRNSPNQSDDYATYSADQQFNSPQGLMQILVRFIKHFFHVFVCAHFVSPNWDVNDV